MLTHRQRQLFEFIDSEITSTGVAPSRQQMTRHLGRTSNGNTNRLLDALVKRGFIRRLPYRARAIEVIKGHNVVPIDVGQRVSYRLFNPTTKQLEPWR